MPDFDENDSQPVARSRRAMLRLAGAAAAGAVAATAVQGRAEAADGGNLVIGQSNSGSNPTVLLGSTFTDTATAPASYVMSGGNLSTNTASIGVQGVAARGAGLQGLSTQGDAVETFNDGTGVHGQGKWYGVWGTAKSGIGVTGHSNTSAGVDAISDSYIDLRCIGTGRMWLAPQSVAGAPTSGNYFRGEFIVDALGDFWVCFEGDGSTAGQWSKFGGAQTAGAYHPLITPARVYDSRLTMTPMASGSLSTGASRTITVKDARNPGTGAVVTSDVVPAGARAVTFNLTVTNTVGSNGYLAVNPGVDTVVHSSHLNWFGSNQKAANAGTTALGADRDVTIICGGTATSTDLIVDVTGYYL